MNQSSEEDVEYFATAGPRTDVAAHAEHVASLPADPSALAEIVRGVLLHNWTAVTMGIELLGDRDGMKIFDAASTIDRILAIDPAPLGQERPPEKRLIGYCYHFALLHTALLRSKGVPARTRCGFANYFDDGKWIDHWVTEYWDGGQWCLNDSQIGLDKLSHDDFRDGVRAWQVCRAGDTNAADHGNGELWGWDELRGSLVNDVGALNKVEVGDWDWCEMLQVEPLDQPHHDVDTQLDAVAELARSERPLAELQTYFRSAHAIQPPPLIDGTQPATK